MGMEIDPAGREDQAAGVKLGAIADDIYFQCPRL
jgi:hypothetical protein